MTVNNSEADHNYAYVHTVTFSHAFCILFHDSERVPNNRKRLRKRHRAYIAYVKYIARSDPISQAKQIMQPTTFEEKRTSL